MKSLCSIIVLLLVSHYAMAQGTFILKDKAKSHRLPFKLINNLVVFPVEINGVELSFLLDTGVSKPILFNTLQGIDTLEVKNTETIFLRGLGGGQPIEAIKSRNNVFRIGNALNINQTLYVIFDSSLNFAPRLGVPIHGIIGYDLFKDFVVELNYSNKVMKLHDPEHYKPKSLEKYEAFDIEFYNSKPYLEAEILQQGKKVPIKLLIDSGGSDALWLFEDDSKQITVPELYFDDFLGNGLSGSIHGKRAKVEKLYLKDFVFNDVNVAYPDSTAIFYARKFKDRNGSISGELLKRFNVIFNYQENKIYLKKNGYFKKPFDYNKSGISLEYGDVRLVKEKRNKYMNVGTDPNDGHSIPVIVVTTYKYSFKPAFTVAELRKDSPADRAGIQINDIILKINGKQSYEYSLQEMIENFYGADGKKIKLKIDRNGKMLNIAFQLENLLHKKSPSN